MLCPKCKNDTLKNWRTYDSDWLPFRQSVLICGHEDCNYKGWYTLTQDEKEYNLRDHEIYKKAYRILCDAIGKAADRPPNGDYLCAAKQLSLAISEVKLEEKLEELE